MLTSERHMNITWICCLVALALQSVSFAMPGWLILTVAGNSSSMTENYAVWYISRCYNYVNMRLGPECVTKSYVAMRKSIRSNNDVSDESSNHMRFAFRTILEWEIEVTCSLAALVAACILLSRLRINIHAIHSTTAAGAKEPSMAKFAITSAFIFTSCMLYTISTVRIAQVNDSLIKMAPLNNLKVGIPYGLITAALGTLVTFGTLLSLSSVLFCKCVRREVNRRTRQCQDQDMPLMPVQSHVIQQPGYARPLPPPYVYQNGPYEIGAHQQMSLNQRCWLGDTNTENTRQVDSEHHRSQQDEQRDDDEQNVPSDNLIISPPNTTV